MRTRWGAAPSPFVAAALASSIFLCGMLRAADPVGTASPPPVFAWGEAGALAAADATNVLIAPLHWDGADWLKFGGAAAAVVATGLLLDNRLHHGSRRSLSPARDDVATVVQRFGAEYSFGVLGGFAIVGLAARDRAAMDVAMDGLLASAIASGLAAPLGKIAVGRSRPDAGEGPGNFRPFSGDSSFPSGHTTQAFTVASVIAAHDGRLWVKVVSFGLAGAVGFARVHENAHWASDVVGGAILGTAVGAAVVRVNARVRAGSSIEPERRAIALTPVLLRGGGGLSVTTSF